MNTLAKLISLGVLVFLLGGCFSPKTDAFLLGAGIGVGAAYYFMNGGKVDGFGKQSITSSTQSKYSIADATIPADLEWEYFQRDLIGR